MAGMLAGRQLSANGACHHGQDLATPSKSGEKTASPLAKAAGPIALVSGVIFAADGVARLLAADRSLDRIEMMRQTPFIVTNALYWVVFIGLVLALVSVYFRLGGRARGLGAVIGGLSSYVLFAVGWMVFGIAGWRLHMFPAWIGVLFVVPASLAITPGCRPTGSP
ncbi:UNVERIFIED_ORG: CHASE2 domain-containing sensor protein [Arthrobacter sp. UYCu721]